MQVPEKNRWTVTGSSGDPRSAIDDNYSTSWIAGPAAKPWLQIDLGTVATLGGLEVYWGKQFAGIYGFESSVDGQVWSHLCSTRHGEGGQNVFAFPPTLARFVRWSEDDAPPDAVREIVELNLYAPGDALSVREEGMLPAFGRGPVKLLPGQSITVDFGYVRSPLGVLIEWGKPYGTVFGVYLSDDGENYRDVGQIATGNGDYDSFYWRTTNCRYFRFTVHAASDPEGAVVNEIKLRILNKDRMPIGQLERAAQAARSDLYPQSLRGRQVYWTVLGEIGHPEEALFDEYGNLEPQLGAGQLMPFLRLDGVLHGAPASPTITQSLPEGVLPIPSVAWSAGNMDVLTTALAHDGEALVEYRITNRGDSTRSGTLVLAVRPVQVNPYWQHGGHAFITHIAVDGRRLWVNERAYATFSPEPAVVTIADFDGGDVARLIDNEQHPTASSLHSDSGLLSAACEFGFELAPGASVAFVAATAMRDDVDPREEADFASVRDEVARIWRAKIGRRKISVGDPEVSDTVEAQTALILLNATRFAFKPGPRNYDRTWIRDGSSQALALLYAGLVEDAKTYVLWYAERIYDNGMVPPILNKDGTINRGYGSDIEFDAQGEFVAIAADTYRLTRDRAFLEAIFEPVVRATRFIEELCARTNALHGPETRFHGLLAPSISHEGYSKPSYSYWDNFFALLAWRDCEFLAGELGDTEVAAHARFKGDELAANLARSMRMTTEGLGTNLIYGSAEREDVDATSTSIAFEPCRAADVLPAEFLKPTYDKYAAQMRANGAPDFDGCFTPYEIRNINAFVALGRFDDAFWMLSAALGWRRPRAWRHWAEVIWGNPRAPEYIGDMPHTWIGAEFATAIRRMLLREDGSTLELFRAVPDAWWEGEGILLDELPSTFGTVTVKAWREPSQVTVELRLAGPLPERVTLRYPGVQQALADGDPCEIDGDLIIAPVFDRVVIDF